MRVLIGRLNQWLNNMHPTLARPHSPAVSAAQRDDVSGISCISCISCLQQFVRANANRLVA